MEEKIRIDFMGGESREVAGTAVNYMIGKTDIAGESAELYAEVVLPRACSKFSVKRGI